MGVNNLGREHSVIVAAVTQGGNSPAGIGRQKNCRGDCEPTPDGARWKGSHRKRRTETGEDLRAKRGRRSLVELREAYGRVQRFQIPSAYAHSEQCSRWSSNSAAPTASSSLSK